MGILKKRSILKLATIFMLVAMMAGAFVGHSKAAVAARAGDCNPTTFVSGTCDTSVTVSPFAGGITFSNDATIAVSGTHLGDNLFTFHTIVKDGRDSAGGWTLQATSSGLLLNGTGTDYLPIYVGSTTLSSTTVCTGSGTCPVVTGLSIPTKTDTSPTFATAASAVSPHADTVDVATHGMVTFAAGTPAGPYSGTIAISLTVA